MPYLLIQNPIAGDVDVELMSTLGLSGSRGNDGRIGCFGSGFPYSLALLARYGLLERTKICIGKQVFTFELDRKHARTADGRKVDATTIVMKKQNGPTYPLNLSVNFGEMDWKDVRLAIREFVSNSIDGVYEYGGTPSKDVVIDTSIPDEGRNTRAKDGFIRVYIPLTDDIQSYIDDLQKYFRCLAPGYNPTRSVWLNTDGGPARVYRRGVLTGTFGKQSLFHYNLNDVHLNESRILDEYTAKGACAAAIAKSESSSIIGTYLSRKLNSSRSDEFFEDGLYVSEMRAGALSFDNDEQRERCKSAFTDAVKRAVSHRVVATSTIAAKVLESKGYEVAQVDSGLADVLRGYGAKTADEVLNANELAGRIISEATPELTKTVDYIWGVIDAHMMTYGRPKPGVKCFHQSTTAGMSGYYRPSDGNIYVKSDIANGTNTEMMVTVLHELNHHITQADDSTYEFVDYAHKLAVVLMIDGMPRG